MMHKLRIEHGTSAHLQYLLFNYRWRPDELAWLRSHLTPAVLKDVDGAICGAAERTEARCEKTVQAAT